MILPIKFFWEQLDGPQVTALMDAIYVYLKQQFDAKLDYINTINVDTANDSHLTFLGILANFTRPIITIPDKNYYEFTEEPEHGSDHGLSSLEDRKIGGKLVGIEGATYGAFPINTEHYRALLKAFIKGEGEIGSLVLLDDICYELSKLDIPQEIPFYTFKFMEGEDIPKGRAPGDLYIDIGNLDNWNNPMHVYAVLRGLSQSIYYPLPQIFISVDTTITVPEPVSSLPSGTYSGPQTIELSILLEGASIYYTTDGSSPSLDSNLYREPIVITESTVIKAKGVKTNLNSSKTVTFTYIIE